MNQNTVAWIFLCLAILAEVAGTTSMKLSNGFTYILPSILIFVFYIISMTFFALSIKRLEMGFAYATWSGLGTLLIYLSGVWFFAEPMTLAKTLSVGCVIIGVMGIKQT